MPKLMHCPDCGDLGYRRKVKRPEWRCREEKCGYEWNDLSSGDLNDIIRVIEERIRSVISSPNLTSIKQHLVSRFPEFDEK